jgi:delta-aminolevulinic acid dehydratase/porphobilinogen synthase
VNIYEIIRKAKEVGDGLKFKHDNGKEFIVLDACMELFIVKGEKGFIRTDDIVNQYEDEPVFSLLN